MSLGSTFSASLEQLDVARLASSSRRRPRGTRSRRAASRSSGAACRELRRALRRKLVRARDVEPALEPGRLDRQVLEQHRPALGDGVVAEPALLDRERRRRVREVLGVPGLVEERAPVVGPAARLDDEDDALGNLDRRRRSARRLVRAILDVELDVFCARGRRRGRRASPRARAASDRRGTTSPTRRARQTRATSQRWISPRPRPMRLRKKRSPVVSHSARSSRGSRGTAPARSSSGYWNAAVELGVVRRAEPLRLAMDDLVLADVELVVLLGRLVPRALEQLARSRGRARSSMRGLRSR